MTIAYSDGGTPDNGGPNAEPYGSYKIDDEPIKRLSFHGYHTNNEAEYLTIIYLLTELGRRGVNDEIIVKTDSRLVVNQVYGVFACRERRLQELLDNLKMLINSFDRLTLMWVSRNEIVKVLGH